MAQPDALSRRSSPCRIGPTSTRARRRAAVLLAAALALAGCGGGGSDATPVAPGASTLASNGAAIDTSYGFLTLFDGTRDLNVEPFSSTGGTVIARSTLAATLQGSPYGRVLVLDLRYDPIYERPSSLGVVAGTWRENSPAAREWRIDAAGTLTGSDAAGCVYQGQVTLIDPARNLYRVTHTVQQCYAATVHVTGHAFLDDTQTAGDTLRSAMTGSYSGFDTFSFVATLTRQ